MSTEVSRLYATVTMDTKGVDAGEKRITDSMSGISSGFKKLLGAVAIGAAIKGAFDFVGDSIKGAMDAQQVSRQLDQTLMSTKGVAGMTREALDSMADSLSRVTPIEDDAISTGQAMLLTFTNIGKKTFPGATEALLDMATAMNSGAEPSAEQLKTQAIQLGKALNDPVAGIGALSRVGVTFTKGQKDTIKALVSTGKVAEAQAIILKELQTEFGGSARAAGQTLPGKLAILEHAFGNIKDSIGGAFIPVLTKGAEALSGFLLDNLPAIENFAEGISDGIGNAVGVVGELWDSFNIPGDLSYRFANVALTIADMIGGPDAVRQVSDAIGVLRSLIGDIGKGNWGGAFETVKAQLVTGFNAIWPALQAAWEGTGGAGLSMEGVEFDFGTTGLKEKLTTAITGVFAEGGLKDQFVTLGGQVMTWIGDGLKTAGMAALDFTADLKTWAESSAVQDSVFSAGQAIGTFVGDKIASTIAEILGNKSTGETIGGGLGKGIANVQDAAMAFGAALGGGIVSGLAAHFESDEAAQSLGKAFASMCIKMGAYFTLPGQLLWLYNLTMGKAGDLGTAIGNAIAGAQQPASIAVRPRALGGDEWVTKPTLFLAGERGPERVQVTPAGGASGGNIIIQPGAIVIKGDSAKGRKIVRALREVGIG